MTKERIPIHKRFLIIDSPVEFNLIANDGTDKVYRPSGCWQLDLWTLLPEKYFKQYPVFNLDVEYDETKLEEGEKFVYRESDINLGTGVAGVNGQLVTINGDETGLVKEDTIKEYYGRLHGVRIPFYKALGFDDVQKLKNYMDIYSTIEVSSELSKRITAQYGNIHLFNNKIFSIDDEKFYDVYSVILTSFTYNSITSYTLEFRYYNTVNKNLEAFNLDVDNVLITE